MPAAVRIFVDCCRNCIAADGNSSRQDCSCEVLRAWLHIVVHAWPRFLCVQHVSFRKNRECTDCVVCQMACILLSWSLSSSHGAGIREICFLENDSIDCRSERRRLAMESIVAHHCILCGRHSFRSLPPCIVLSFAHRSRHFQTRPIVCRLTP